MVVIGSIKVLRNSEVYSARDGLKVLNRKLFIPGEKEDGGSTSVLRHLRLFKPLLILWEPCFYIPGSLVEIQATIMLDVELRDMYIDREASKTEDP